MKISTRKIIWLFVLFSSVQTVLSQQSVKVTQLPIDFNQSGKYARSFIDVNGDLHIKDVFKVSLKTQAGKLSGQLQNQAVSSDTALHKGIMNYYLVQPGFFFGLCEKIMLTPDSNFMTLYWHSHDNLKTIKEDTTTFIIPEAGKVDFGKKGEWAGLFCHRGILRLRDESCLTAMYGNFQMDTIKPSNPWSRMETKYKARAFVARSTDKGKTWRYLSSVAIPVSGKEDDSEGYNEWTMVQLNDGRIFAVIRTGHFTPFVTSISSDEGKTWSTPKPAPELGPGGCDPFLLKMEDGRIALSYGEMVQPKNREAFNDDFVNKCDRSRRCMLAISSTPGADHWQSYNITNYGDRTAYSTIYQVQPGLILYQTDLELYQIKNSE